MITHLLVRNGLASDLGCEIEARNGWTTVRLVFETSPTSPYGLGSTKDITIAVVAVLVVFSIVFGGVYYYETATLTPANSSQTAGPSGSTTPTPTGGSSLVALTLQGPRTPSPGPGSVLCGVLATATASPVTVGMPAGPAGPFSPQSITVVIGVNNTINWTNSDPKGITHTVTSNQGLFNSGDLAKNGQFTCTFVTPGTYYYRCIYHPLMVGAVFVKSS